MLLGKVLGTVVSTRKDEELEGLKFLLVQGADPKGEPNGPTVGCADAVGAGVGELVLYAAGSFKRACLLIWFVSVCPVTLQCFDTRVGQ